MHVVCVKHPMEKEKLHLAATETLEYENVDSFLVGF